MKLIKSIFNKKLESYSCYFAIFEKIYLLSPNILYWVNCIPAKPHCYIITHFKHQQFLRYNGLELVVIDNNEMTYHRLPGARPAGKGFVNLGTHYVNLNFMNDKELHYLEVQKKYHSDLEITKVTSIPDLSQSYSYLTQHKYEYLLFIPELKEIILAALNWYYISLSLKLLILDDQLLELINTIIRNDNDVDPRILSLAKRIYSLYVKSEATERMIS